MTCQIVVRSPNLILLYLTLFLRSSFCDFYMKIGHEASDEKPFNDNNVHYTGFDR